MGGSDAPLGLGGQLVGVALALLLVLGLAWAVLRLMARWSAARPADGAALRIERVLSVGGRERLVVVRYAGAELLLGVTPGGIQVLHRRGVDGDALPSEPGPPSS